MLYHSKKIADSKNLCREDCVPRLEVISLETINTCNRDCWFCEFGQKRLEYKTQKLSLSVIENILEQLCQANFNGRISPYGINEPLMDSRIITICEMIRYMVPNAYVFILTNGDLLTKDIVYKLQNLSVDIAVSVYDQKTLDKCVDLSVRYVDRRDSNFADNRGGNIVQLVGNDEYLHTNCLRPSSMMQIKYDNKVVLCCCDFYGQVVLGDASKDSIYDIWHGSKLNQIRKELATKGRANLPLCEHCNHDGSSQSVYWPVNSL